MMDYDDDDLKPDQVDDIEVLESLEDLKKTNYN